MDRYVMAREYARWLHDPDTAQLSNTNFNILRRRWRELLQEEREREALLGRDLRERVRDLGNRVEERHLAEYGTLTKEWWLEPDEGDACPKEI